jgi:hypothetical protein
VKLRRSALRGSCLASEIELYKKELVEHMQADEELIDITDEQYFSDLMTGKFFPGATKLYSICDMEQVHVKVFNDTNKSEFTYRCSGAAEDTLHLVKLDDYFAVRMQDDLE